MQGSQNKEESIVDFFKIKNISPMLLVSQDKPFDDDNYIYELKLDGIRCIAYLDTQTSLRNKKNKELLPLYPELSNIHKQARERCVLDGELVVLNADGSPNFQLLQKRSLMTDSLKIELESQKHRVHFVAYDILQAGEKDLTDMKLLKRKEYLASMIKENDAISISRFIERQGIELFNLTTKLNLEGIVAKAKDSKYELGKRSKNWIKIKNYVDEDLLICGILLDEKGNIKDLVLGQLKNKTLIDRGKVFLHISKEEQKIILSYARSHKINRPLFDNLSKDIVWIEPKLVCTIEYMNKTDDGNMRQPVFKALRDDK